MVHPEAVREGSDLSVRYARGVVNHGLEGEAASSTAALFDRFLGGVSAQHRVELGLDDLAVAVGADAVAEADVGVVRDVLLHLLPVVPVIPDLLAVGADGQEA